MAALGNSWKVKSLRCNRARDHRRGAGTTT
jgi:hypothetical protein